MPVTAIRRPVLTRRRDRVYILGVATFITALVGLTRIYLGVHWTTDVLAGWAAGAAWATACWLAGRWLKQRGVARQTVPDKGAGAVS